MKQIKYIPIVLFRDLSYLFKKNLPLKFKIKYPFSKYSSLIRNFLIKKKKISYLDNTFKYDNWTIPISLQAYPHEIIYKILKNIDQPLNSILDIGGNIGQFCITTNFFLPKSNIYVFEPNKAAYKILEKNTKKIKKIKIFNYGIGRKSKKPLYFMNNRSATGSLIKNNAEISKLKKSGKLKKTTIELINDIKKVTGKNKFDLIKIDVEGYEFEVIKNIKDVKTNYLFIEISGNRQKNYVHSELFNLIKNKFGNYNIIYQSKFNKNNQTFDILLKFIY